MTLQTRLQDLANAIGADIKALNAEIAAMPTDLSQLVGNLTLAQQAPNTVFYVYWRPTASRWELRSAPGVAVTSRPTSRTDVTMVLVGGTEAQAPTWMQNDDLHLFEAAP